MDLKFYKCERCGNIVEVVENKGGTLFCCGAPMAELTVNTVEASHEKHIPVVTVEGNTVRVNVGSVTHPMSEEHHIAWIYLQTNRGGQRKCLDVTGAPEVTFALADETPVAVYAYCNLHGLWKADI